MSDRPIVIKGGSVTIEFDEEIGFKNHTTDLKTNRKRSIYHNPDKEAQMLDIRITGGGVNEHFKFDNSKGCPTITITYEHDSGKPSSTD